MSYLSRRYARIYWTNQVGGMTDWRCDRFGLVIARWRVRLLPFSSWLSTLTSFHVHTGLGRSPSSIIWYRTQEGDALRLGRWPYVSLISWPPWVTAKLVIGLYLLPAQRSKKGRQVVTAICHRSVTLQTVSEQPLHLTIDQPCCNTIDKSPPNQSTAPTCQLVPVTIFVWLRTARDVSHDSFASQFHPTICRL